MKSMQLSFFLVLTPKHYIKLQINFQWVRVCFLFGYLHGGRPKERMVILILKKGRSS